MPIVPLRPSVSPGPLPAVRLPVSAPIEAFGGGVAAERGAPDLSGVTQATDRIAAEQQRIRLEEKARADQVAVTDAIAQRTQHSTYLLHDPNTGALNQFGKNAFGLPETVHTAWNDVNNVIRNGLANDDQKAAYDRFAANDWANTNLQVQRHVSAQIKDNDNETTATVVASMRDKALANYDDPATVDMAIAYQSAAIRDHGKRFGLPDETIDQNVAKQASATRTAVLETMLDDGQGLTTAVKYFQDHRDDFVGNDLVRAEKLTKQASRLAAAQHAADAIAHSTTTLGDALKQTESINDPQVRDDAEKRLRQHFNDLAADQRQDRNRAFMTLSTKLEQNGGNVDRLKATADWLALTPTEHDQLEHRAKIMRHPDEGPGDNEAYLTLLNEAYFNPEQFATRAIPGEQGLNAAQKTRLMTLQRSVGAKVHAAETGPLLKAIDAANKNGTPSPSDAESSALNSDPALDAALHGRTSSPAPAEQQAAPKLAPPTPQMLLDIARKGPRYAAYLRLHGIDAPDVVPTATPQGNAVGDINLPKKGKKP